MPRMPGQQPPLVHQPLLVRVHRPPHVIRTVAPDIAVESSCPTAARRPPWSAKRNTDHGRANSAVHPSCINPAFRLPNGVPTAIRAVGREQLVRLHAIGGHGEAHPVHAIVEAVEPDAKHVRVAAAIPLDQLVQNAVRRWSPTCAHRCRGHGRQRRTGPPSAALGAAKGNRLEFAQGSVSGADAWSTQHRPESPSTTMDCSAT